MTVQPGLLGHSWPKRVAMVCSQRGRQTIQPSEADECSQAMRPAPRLGVGARGRLDSKMTELWTANSEPGPCPTGTEETLRPLLLPGGA